MKLWYRLVRSYVAWGLKVYFTEIRVTGVEHVPTQGPVMLAVNHQNAFMDALLVATTNRRRTHFLVRADVFRFGAIRAFFSSLNMMPVYRIRDGRDKLQNNHEIFEKCFSVLGQGHALMLFPEANHHQRRLLLPLSKGFTRIALGSDTEIKIVPVGINYTHHRLFGSKVSVCYGPPIDTSKYQKRDAKSSRVLRNEMSSAMQDLITCIPDDQYYSQYEAALDRYPDSYLDPISNNQWIQNTSVDQLNIKKEPEKQMLGRIIAGKVCIMLHLLPVIVCSAVLKKLNDPVFSTSIKFLTGILLFPLYYLLLAAVLYLLSGTVITLVVLTLCFLSILWYRLSFPLSDSQK